ncbi:MAG: carbohydrate kinase [Lachnospiraceae bacterium]|nr:carbohydrate kinase [Lachnospiraceae bacterium]
MKIAGLDIGTTGCKCTVFDEGGRELGHAYRDYPVRRGIGGHEIDVNLVMDGVYAVISEMAGEYDDIAGIGVTSFGETFVMTDENGEVLAPAMLYTDPRGASQCARITDMLGREHIAGITGVCPHEMYGIPKMMWRKEHDPEVYGKTKHILQMEDFVVFSLTGNAVIDYSLATRSMAFDITTLSWSTEIFDAAGIDVGLMSRSVPTGSDAGTVKKSVADKTGLSEKCRVIAMCQDQVAAAIGSGAFTSDIAVDGAGTVQCLTPVFDEKPDVSLMMPGKYSIVPYIIPGTYVTYAFTYTGGALIDWASHSLAKHESALAKEQGISVNSCLEQQYADKRKQDNMDPEGPSGMLVLPHFAGAATPYMDTESKGVIVGLTTETSVAEIYRGCMEGVTYEMYLNYRNVAAAGAKIRKLHATGGGARSQTWMQMKADVLGLPIVALNTVDAGTVGCAVMTGIALGVYKDLDDAASHLIETRKTYEPREAYHEKYMEVFERYEKLYDAVRPIIF